MPWPEPHAKFRTPRSNLEPVKLLGRKKADTSVQAAPATAEAATDESTPATKAAPGTAPKGRPTPKRDAAKRRGPVAPAPLTSSEARARRKAQKKAAPKLSKEERKAEKIERRARMNERRERMMSGEEAYLLPRDQGPVRRYVRDLVDSRRNVLGLFMPAAIGLIFFMLAVPKLSAIVSPLMLGLMGVMLIDAVFLSRYVGGRVDEKFPDNTEGRWKLGFYAAGRASQLRRMRAPRPRVNRGDEVR